MTKLLSRRWQLFLGVSLVAGLLLRLLFVQDMEWKEDEQYNFIQGMAVAHGQGAFSWVGMPSGVYVPNPGMSVWVFAMLAKLPWVHDPTDLARAVQLFAVLGISLILPFALRFIREREEREPWLWAFALAMVNPFLVLYQRKLWPEPFLPFFTMLALMGWWKRERFGWAFLWGMIGAWLGQIHMSGFFFAFGVFLWTALFEERPRRVPGWLPGWFAGSIAGSAPLVPWLLYILRHPTPQSVGSGWGEALQLKFWVFWLTNPTGLHLGNPLGLLRGQSTWSQISDFVRYPVLAGHATYLNLLAHLVALGASALILGRGLVFLARQGGRGLRRLILGRQSPTAFLQESAVWGFGGTLTLTTINIRRYYMMVDFPLELTFLARAARAAWGTAAARRILLALWASQLFMSTCFVGYVHVHGGSTDGDYGVAYRLIREDEERERLRSSPSPTAPGPSSAGTPAAAAGNPSTPATGSPPR